MISALRVARDTDTVVGCSIVIPCLNEIRTLPDVIRKAREALGNLEMPSEIIVADNGSTDGSIECAEALGCRVVNADRRGYGSALYCGVSAADYKYIIIGDADDSYDFRDGVPMVEQLIRENADLCVGSRLRGTIMPLAMPWKNRYIGTPALNKILNTVHNASYSDVNSGLRAFTKSAFLKMEPNSDGMEFASEMLVKAALLKLRVCEVPITLYRDGRNRPPHLRPWHDGWRHLKFILLFAPKQLIVFPALAALAFAFAFAAFLGSSPSGRGVHAGPFVFNDHWVIADAMLALIAFQAAATGILTHIYTLTHRLEKRSRTIDWATEHIRIESLLIAAAICVALGISIEAGVVQTWFKGDFAALNAIRPAVIGMTLVVMGVQTVSNGFFYAVLREQYKAIE